MGEILHLIIVHDTRDVAEEGIWPVLTCLVMSDVNIMSMNA